MEDKENKFTRTGMDGTSNVSCNTSSDLSMVLALINDIVRMQQNLDNMDVTVKGVSQLRNRTKSMLATLQSHGYEVVELLGRSWHEGDNIVGTLELNEVR